jgi:hypothetical protein
MVAADGPGAGVLQQERAGPIGGLGLAGAGAALAEQGGLLVAHEGRDGGGGAERGGLAHDAAGGHHLGQHGVGHAEEVEQVSVPVAFVDVPQHGAARVGRVGGVAAGERPCEPRIDGAEGELPFARPGPQSFLREHPLQFRGGEVRVEDETGATLDVALPFGAQGVAAVRGAAVLPHDGWQDRLAGAAVPEDGGLALVRDAHRSHVRCLQPGVAQRRPAHLAHRG